MPPGLYSATEIQQMLQGECTSRQAETIRIELVRRRSEPLLTVFTQVIPELCVSLFQRIQAIPLLDFVNCSHAIHVPRGLEITTDTALALFGGRMHPEASFFLSECVFCHTFLEYTGAGLFGDFVRRRTPPSKPPRAFRLGTFDPVSHLFYGICVACPLPCCDVCETAVQILTPLTSPPPPATCPECLRRIKYLGAIKPPERTRKSLRLSELFRHGA